MRPTAALLLLEHFGWQLHVFGRNGNGCALLRYINVRRPQDAVHNSLSKCPYAEVVVKMAADKAEGSSAFGIAPFVDPTNRVILAFDDRAKDRPCFGEKAELEVELLAQLEIAPAAANRVLGIGLTQFGSLHQVS